jgi:transaldolase/glucose-6-phosphate isomerase
VEEGCQLVEEGPYPPADLAADIQQDGFSHIVLLGMGGSSLVVEVFRLTFGRLARFPELHVLDSTDPATIQQIESRIGAERSLS